MISSIFEEPAASISVNNCLPDYSSITLQS